MSSLLRLSSEFPSGVQPSNGKSVLLTSEYCRCEILNSIGYGLRLLRINFKGSCQPTRKINAEGNDGNQAERQYFTIFTVLKRSPFPYLKVHVESALRS